MADIQNPGSALGEAIGAQMELALNKFLRNLCEDVGYHFVSSSMNRQGLPAVSAAGMNCRRSLIVAKTPCALGTGKFTNRRQKEIINV